MSDLSLEARIRRLEDIESIKQLKARYAAACDDDYNANALAKLFTEDAIWDGGPMGCHKGQDAIRQFFSVSDQVVPFAIHHVTNPIIEITVDRATGQWGICGNRAPLPRATRLCGWAQPTTMCIGVAPKAGCSRTSLSC